MDRRSSLPNTVMATAVATMIGPISLRRVVNPSTRQMQHIVWVGPAVLYRWAKSSAAPWCPKMARPPPLEP